MPLDRLEKRGLLDSYLADPTPERGGRSKRIYTPTKKGQEALEEIRRIHEAAWKGMPRKTTSDV
jgi:DNA-binding PadR family transcriptional regulator